MGMTYAGGGQCFDEVTFDGEPDLAERPVQSGHVVELYKGSISYPTGLHGFGVWIDIRRTVIGPVEAIDASHLQLTVLGQRVFVTDQTQGGDDVSTDGLFDFANIAVGDRVSVSGHFTAEGHVIATRIEYNAVPGQLVLRGILMSMPNGQFAIGEQVIDLSAATLIDFPGGTPLAGDAVLLFADDVPQGGVFVLQKARFTGGNRDPSGTTIFEFTGFVTSSPDPHEFDIEGYRFSDSTLGCDSCNRLSNVSAALPVGTAVRYFGSTGYEPPPLHTYLSLNSDSSNDTTLNGRIDSVDPAHRSLIVAGFKVQTSPATHISEDDEPWVGSHTLNIAEYYIGDVVNVIGGAGPAPDNSLVASKIGPPDGAETRVTARQYERADPAIIVLGRSIQTDTGTTVTICDGTGACTAETPTWLFDNADPNPPELTINIDPVAVPLRATHIVAVQDD